MDIEAKSAGSLPPGWKKPLPEQLAPPTFWPAMLALGINIALLGVVTQYLIAVAGVVISAVSLGGWIGAFLHE